MTEFVVDVLGAVGFAFGFVVVHEYGHLLAGRVLGVPAPAIRVELAGRPPHTALRRGDRWLRPEDSDYADAFREHRPERWAAWTYVAGGLVVETAATTASVLVLVAAGAEEVGIVLAWVALLLAVTYLIVDVALTTRSRRPYGDHALLWQLHRGATCLLVAVALGTKVGAVIVGSR